MPNIEIHGLNEGEALNKSLAIGFIVKREAPELMGIAVITRHNDICHGLDSSESQPYLRICSTDPAHIEKLKTILVSLKWTLKL